MKKFMTGVLCALLLAGCASADVKPVTEKEPAETASENVAEAEPEETPAEVQEEKEESAETEIRPEVKEFWDGYEDFMMKYCDFMESYDESNISMLAEYASLLNEYAEWSEKAEKEQPDDMTVAETSYVLDVENRVQKRLLEVQR